MHRSPAYIALSTLIFLLLIFTGAPANGEEVDEVAISLGLDSEYSATPSRFTRPVSGIAENVTVITAQDISRLNAHTLAEVLHTIPGIQLNQLQSPGSSVFFTMLSISSQHILVQIDGVPINFLSLENFSEIGNIPVQMIDRVEIVKGAASAAWGPALGGVINITTKSPATERKLGGMASASLAEHSTSDLRGEISGTVERFGYYLTGGNMHSDGLAPGNRSNLNHGFGKFTFNTPNEGRITLGVDVRDNTMGLEDSASYNIRGTGDLSYLNSYLSLSYPLAERLTLELNGRGGRRYLANQRFLLSPSVQIMDGEVRERYQGAGAGVNWGDARTNLSAGIEYEHDEFDQREPVRRSPLLNFELSLRRWSGYLNGTYTIGGLSILPGVRLDHIDLIENAVSYTLGATYALTDNTLLRAYAARGYSLPMINNWQIVNGERQLQDILTLQTGFETSAIPYLWLKGTLFYNNIWDIQTFDPALGAIVLRDHIRRGIELEFRTSPVYGFAFTGGYTYTDAWDKETGEELTSGDIGPRQGLKLGVNYDNSAIGLRGALTGNYVDWHQPELPPEDSSVIWDLHLTRKLFPRDEMSPELFFSVRNIFNDKQYLIDIHSNPGRWFEAGMRYRF